MFEASISLIKKKPPAFAETEQERTLAQFAEARNITRLDAGIAFVIMADFVLTSIDLVTKWCYVGFIDIILTTRPLMLYASMRIFVHSLGGLCWRDLLQEYANCLQMHLASM